MNIELETTYTPATAAVVLNVSIEWISKWIDRAIQRGWVKPCKEGTKQVLGRDLVVIGRKAWQDYESEVRLNAFNKQRAREHGWQMDEVIE
jgi:hypothetical protein